MAASSRRKGLKGEQEVARLLRAHGKVVRRLGGKGDVLTAFGTTYPLHLEVKRAERLKLPEWLRQAQAEAPDGNVPVVAFRQNNGEWYACLPLAALVELAS
jgi:Holliday junction resolvase